MSFLNDIQLIFNNREIAFLLWILVVVLVLLMTKLRKSLVPIIKILTSRSFLIIFTLIGAYLFIIILFLKSIGFWESVYLKDVIFWFFSVGLISVFRIIDVKNKAYFKVVFLSAIKWTILLEFVVNLYSFKLIFEIVVLPILIFMTAVQVCAEFDEKNKDVVHFLQNFLTMSILLIFLYSLYKTIVNFSDVFTFKTLVTFLLPSTITILFIPFLYMLALYIIYESYFINIDFMTTKKDEVREVKKIILRTAHIDIDKLIRIKKNFQKKVFYDNTNMREYIREISEKSNDNI